MKVGLLGAGSIAGVMAETLNRMDTATCYAVASRTLAIAQDVCAKIRLRKGLRLV